jgi:hypothetical protein
MRPTIFKLLAFSFVIGTMAQYGNTPILSRPYEGGMGHGHTTSRKCWSNKTNRRRILNKIQRKSRQNNY